MKNTNLKDLCFFVCRKSVLGLGLMSNGNQGSHVDKIDTPAVAGSKLIPFTPTPLNANCNGGFNRQVERLNFIYESDH